MVDGLLVLCTILASFALADVSLRGSRIMIPVLFFLLVAFVIIYPDDEQTKKGLVFVLMSSVLSALIVKEVCCSDKMS